MHVITHLGYKIGVSIEDFKYEGGPIIEIQSFVICMVCTGHLGVTCSG